MKSNFEKFPNLSSAIEITERLSHGYFPVTFSLLSVLFRTVILMNTSQELTPQVWILKLKLISKDVGALKL